MAQRQGSSTQNNPPQKQISVVEIDEEGNDMDVDSLSEGEDGTVSNYCGPTTFHIHPFKPFDDLALEYFNGHEHGMKVTEEARRLVESGKMGFYGFGMKGNGMFSDKKFWEWLNGGAREMVKGYVGGSGHDGIGAVIIFGTASFDKLLVKEYDTKLKDWPSETMKLMWGDISPAVPIITCFGSGVIANIPREDHQGGILETSVELESDKLPFLAGMVIPKVNGLGIGTFVITEAQCVELQGKKMNMAKCLELLGITPEIQKGLKGIAFFHACVDKWTENYNDSPAVAALHIYLRANPHVAMAGGIQPTLLFNGSPDDTVIACGILIFGRDDKVRVNCAAMNDPEMSFGNKQKLNKLKTTLKTSQDDEEELSSFAIMFGCKERGVRMHGRANVESAYFNHLFPKTKLIGGFDFGEFYNEILVHYPKVTELDPPAQIHFIHATAFLLVSYLHPTV